MVLLSPPWWRESGLLSDFLLQKPQSHSFGHGLTCLLPVAKRGLRHAKVDGRLRLAHASGFAPCDQPRLEFRLFFHASTLSTSYATKISLAYIVNCIVTILRRYTHFGNCHPRILVQDTHSVLSLKSTLTLIIGDYALRIAWHGSCSCWGMTTTNHTPSLLPWHQANATIDDANNQTVVILPARHEWQANARLIVQAVNSHVALVEALLALETAAKSVYNDPYSTCHCADSLREPLTRARAALALANT